MALGLPTFSLPTGTMSTHQAGKNKAQLIGDYGDYRYMTLQSNSQNSDGNK